MTRKRRYLLSAAVLAACVCLALGVLAMLPPRPGVTKANFDRVEVGMTIDEANSVFGGKWNGDVSSSNGRRIAYIWIGPDGSEAFINVSGEIVTAGKDWHPATETFSDKLRRWLHLPASK